MPKTGGLCDVDSELKTETYYDRERMLNNDHNNKT